MKTDHVQIAFLAIGLILLAALQDMVPPFCGAKPPFLLVFALYVALTTSGRSRRRNGDRPVTRWMWTACAAGYLLEALSGLPIGSCICFMLPVCALARFLLRSGNGYGCQVSVSLGLVVATVFAPLQEAWLGAWGAYGGGSSFVRFVASALPAAATGAVLFSILPRIERFAGLREEVGR